MASQLTLPTYEVLLGTNGRPYWRFPVLVWTARARSGDLLFRGAPRQHGGYGRQVCEVQQLFGTSYLAWVRSKRRR